MNESSHKSIGRTVLAGLILLVAGWILLSVVIHIVAGLFFPILAIAAIVGIVWAYRTLF
jgi:H+/Cl- antiporter ClcA